MAQSQALNNVFKLRDIINVKEPRFGAKGDGATNDTAAFQAAIDSVASGSPVYIYIPRSTSSYLLSTDVVANGRIPSFMIDPGATFSGAGTLPSIDVGNYGDIGYKNAGIVFQRGSSGTPITDKSPLGLMKKISSAAPSGADADPVFAVMGERRSTTTSGARLTGLWSEVEDYAGGTGTFVEGGRFGSTLESGSDGSSYGVIGLAGCESTVTSVDYMIAMEGVTSNNKTDDPAIGSFDENNYSACFVATSHFGTKKVGVGFACNPFNDTGGEVATLRAGFFCPAGSIDSGAGHAFRNAAACVNAFINAGAVTRAFANSAAATYGIDLNLNTPAYSTAAMRLGNGITNSMILARNAANSADHNIFYYSAADKVTIGTGAVATTLCVVDNTIANPLMRDVVYGAAGSGSIANHRQLQVPN